MPLQIIQYARGQAKKKSPHLQHPQFCLDAIEAGVLQGGKAGLLKEKEAFAKSAALDTHKALVHIFFAQRTTKKVRGVTDQGLKPRSMKCIAVLGGGLMGSGIATAAALSGIRVLLKEINQKFLDDGLGRIKVPLRPLLSSPPFSPPPSPLFSFPLLSSPLLSSPPPHSPFPLLSSPLASPPLPSPFPVRSSPSPPPSISWLPWQSSRGLSDAPRPASKPSQSNLASAVKKGVLKEPQAQHVMGLIKGVLTYDDFKQADMVIEAALEDVGLKVTTDELRLLPDEAEKGSWGEGKGFHSDSEHGTVQRLASACLALRRDQALCWMAGEGSQTFSCLTKQEGKRWQMQVATLLT